MWQDHSYVSCAFCMCCVKLLKIENGKMVRKYKSVLSRYIPNLNENDEYN